MTSDSATTKGRVSSVDGAEIGGLVVTVGLYLALRIWLALSANGSFAHQDEYWFFGFDEHLRTLSPWGFLRAVADWDWATFYGGCRINGLIFSSIARITGPSYLLLKTVSLAWGIAILITVHWALRESVSRWAAMCIGLLLAVPPRASIVLSLVCGGNHAEIPFFIMASLGLSLRLRRALLSGDFEAARLRVGALGLVAGIGVYYCQSFHAWLAVFAPAGFVFVSRGRGVRFWKRLVGPLLLGSVPGLLLLWFAYVPENILSIFIPYASEPRPFWAGEPTATIGRRIVEAAMLWQRGAHSLPPAMETGALFALDEFGTSLLWFPLAAALAWHSSSRDLRFVTFLSLVFVGSYLLIAVVAELTMVRYLIPLFTPLAIVQGWTIGQGLPELAHALSYRKTDTSSKAPASKGMRILIVVLGAMLVPRFEMVSRMGGVHSLSEGMQYSGELTRRIFLHGMARPHQRALEPVVAALDSLPMTQLEREVLLHGLGTPLEGSSGLDPYNAIPLNLGEEVVPLSPLARKQIVWLDSGVDRYREFLHSFLLGHNDVERAGGRGWRYTDPLYYAGVALTLDALGMPWDSPREQFMPGRSGKLCERCEIATLAPLWELLESDQAVSGLQELLCEPASPE
ncbi:MAG: hypothetical protein CME06_18055 [Gemmatimonadetes bacterium]|nr:hypothetical protein [Gemmatimonadota bacterium]